jgi:asparagine synthase (glutamine-hydrolysing)
MCGISGVFDPTGNLPSHGRDQCQAMNDYMVHRGPDGGGLVEAPGCVLGHRRLSIIDLEGGVQPMLSADQAVGLVFNGEIYNFPELRKELTALGTVFRTRSDTEVLLEGYRAWGEKVVEKLRGMFAFVLHDRAANKVFGARDPIGKKPLFLCMKGTTLYFTSEPGALVACGAASGSLAAEAVQVYFNLGYVPAPYGMYSGVTKVAAGQAFRYAADGFKQWTYWELPSAPSAFSETQALERLESYLEKAVSLRMVSDVPLGAFLSGGVDSNLVVATMAGQSSQPVRTFCAGFGEHAALAGVRDERELAAEAAQAYGAVHEEIRLQPDDAIGLLPHLVARLGEPLADPSCIPTFLVCRAARKHVTVALTGDGGDEPFGGYSFRYLPYLLEQRLRGGLLGSMLRPAAQGLAGLWPESDGLPRPLRLRTLFRNLATGPLEAFFMDQALLELDQKGLRPNLRASGNPALDHMRKLFDGPFAHRDALTRALYVDARLYMCENVLVKADRMSMANSLELRSPLLDQDLLAFAFSLPPSYKIRGKECKRLLRLLARRKVPEKILDQPKTGFSLPYDQYLRKQWRGVFEDAVLGEGYPHSGSLCAEYLDMDHLRQCWREFQAGRNRHLRFLWAAFIFTLWSRPAKANQQAT